MFNNFNNYRVGNNNNKMRIKQLWYRLKNKLQLYIFTRQALQDLKDRKGKCKRCGQCCKKNNWTCPLLSYNKKGLATCEIYKSSIRPYSCIIAPTRLDFKAGAMSKNCGYYYPEMRNCKTK